VVDVTVGEEDLLGSGTEIVQGADDAVEVTPGIDDRGLAG
jgi:hypothetical protein